MFATAASPKVDTKSDSKSTPAAILPAIEKHSKRDLYIKIFQQEFVRELEYLWDVANKRAVARDKFTTQLAALLTAAAPYVPVVGTAAAGFASAVEFAANQVRDKETLSVANLRDQLDLPRLTLIADVVAREAYRRYEFFIVNRLSDQAEDGVIPFAKVGVVRVLEHLARKRGGAALSALLREKLTPVLGDAKRDPKNDILVELSESFLLAGLVEGRSGSFVQGVSNNEIKLNKTEKNIVGAVKTSSVDAEDVYARSGLMHFEIKQGNLTRTIYRRSAGRHQEGSAGVQLKRLFGGETESLYNFGYAKCSTDKAHEWDPVCGYAVMPLSVIEQRYNFKQHGQTHKVSHELESELQRQSLTVVPIDKETFKQYIAWCRKDAKNIKHTVADYLRMQKIWLGAQWVVCQEDLSELNLQGLNLSRMDLSSSTLSGDLTGTQFVESYLISTRFVKVTSAKQTNFRQAHCAHLKADGIDFTDADFTQADCSFAKLRKAKLVRCKTFGTIWHETDLREIESDVDLLKAQQAQLNQLGNDVKQQRAELKQFSEILFAQSEKLNQLQQQVSASVQQALTTNKDSKDTVQLQALTGQIQQLVKQQESRTVFERYCQHDINALQQSIQQAASKETLDDLKQQLQQTQQQLKAMQQTNMHAVQSTTEESAKQVDVLGNQYQTLKSDLKKIHGEVQKELALQVKKQVERFAKLETQINLVAQQLTVRLEQLEKRVDNVEAGLMRLDIKLDAQRPEITVAHKIQKLRLAVLDDKFITSELNYYVDPNGQVAPGIDDISPLYQWVDKELLQSEAQVLLLQGDAGAGKSTFNRFLLRQLWQAPAWNTFKPGDQAPKAYLPFFIALGTSRIQPDKLLSSLDLPTSVENFTDAEMTVLKRDYNLLIIADGYDEMPQQRTLNLYDANQLHQYQGRIKLLIGCRTQRAQELNENTWFVPHDDTPEGRERFALYKKRHVAPFDDKQIADYLTKYLAKNQNNKELRLLKDVETYQKQLQLFPELQALITTPFLLLVAVEILPSLMEDLEKQPKTAAASTDSKDSKTADGKSALPTNSLQLTRAKIYDRFMENWFRRQEHKLRLIGQLPARGDIKNDYRKFCLALAQRFHLAQITAVQYPQEQEAGSSLDDLFMSTPTTAVVSTATAAAPSSPTDAWVEKFFGEHPDMVRARTGSPLRIRPGNWHEFIHASLVDYFITTHIWQQAQQLVQKLNAPIDLALTERLLTRDQLYFLADRIKQDKTFENYCWQVIERSKQDAKVAIAAANAITILNAAEINFSGKNLSNVRIPSADLSGALCDGTNFQGADLSGVNFQASWLRNSNCKGAKLDDIHFGQLPVINMSHAAHKRLCSPNRRWLAIDVCNPDSEKKNIYIYDLLTRQHVQSFPRHEESAVWVWDPQSNRLAITAGDKNKHSLRVWEVVTGKELFSIEGEQKFSELAWDPTGERLIFANEQAISICNLKTGEIENSISGYTGAVTVIKWDPKGESFACAFDNVKEVHMFKADTTQYLPPLEGHTDTVYSIHWDPSGKRLATTGEDKTIRIWSAETGQELCCLLKHIDMFMGIPHIQWSPTGNYLASIAKLGPGYIYIWNVASAKLHVSLIGHTLSVRSFDWDSKGEYLVSASNDETVRVWEVASGKELLCLRGHEQEVAYVAWDISGKRLISAGEHDYTVRTWEISAGKELRGLKGHKDYVETIVADPKSERIATGSRDNTIRIWDIGTGKELVCMHGHTGWIGDLAWDAQGKYLLSNSNSYDDKTSYIWDVTTGNKISSITLTGFAQKVFWDSNGRGLIAGISEEAITSVKVWDVMTGKEINHFIGHIEDEINNETDNEIPRLLWSSKGERLASIRADFDIRVFDIASSKEVCHIDAHGQSYCMVWSPAGNLLASGGMHKTIQIWDIQSGKELFSLEGHTSDVNALAWNAKGDRLASSSSDGTVRVWDMKTGKQQHCLEGHTHQTSSVDWDVKGEYLVSGSRDKTIRIWNSSTGKQIHQLNFPQAVACRWFYKGSTTGLLAQSADNIAYFEIKFSANDCHCVLQSLIGLGANLHASDINLTNATGLSSANYELLQQRGAVGKPIMIGNRQLDSKDEKDSKQAVTAPKSASTATAAAGTSAGSAGGNPHGFFAIDAKSSAIMPANNAAAQSTQKPPLPPKPPVPPKPQFSPNTLVKK